MCSSLCTDAGMVGRALTDLWGLQKTIQRTARPQMLDMYGYILREAVIQICEDVNDNDSLSKDQRSIDEYDLKQMASSWLAMFNYSLEVVKHLLDLSLECSSHAGPVLTALEAVARATPRDPPPQLHLEAPHSEIEIAFQQHSALMLTFKRFRPTMMVPIRDDHATGHGGVSLETRIERFVDKVTGASTMATLKKKHPDWQAWRSQATPTGEQFNGSCMAALWMHFGIEQLSLGGVAQGEINWQGEYLSFVSDNPGSFREYCSFIQGAKDLDAELRSSKEGARGIFTIVKHASKSFPEAMKTYVRMLKGMSAIRQKFDSNPDYHGVCDRLESSFLLELCSFVDASSAPIGSASFSSGVEMEVNVDAHLDAVRVACDMVVTYKGLDVQPLSTKPSEPPAIWQTEEWATLGHMVELARTLQVADHTESHCGFWNPRVLALRTMVGSFSQLSYKKAKAISGADADPKIHFANLTKVLDGVFLRKHETFASFKTQMNRLAVYIEFNMSMPSIPVRTNATTGLRGALDLYMDEMNKPERREMTRASGDKGITEEQQEALGSSYDEYEEEFNQLERKYMGGIEDARVNAVPNMVADIFKCATKPCFSGEVKGWGSSHSFSDSDSDSDSFHAQLPLLLARLAFLFSLQRSDLIEGDSILDEGVLKPVRPHCIQVLGILALLNAAKQGRCTNQIAEVLTGQGKSWVLQLLGSVFACTGKDVIVLCHNPDLTSRDQADAQPFLDILKSGQSTGASLGSVRYQTYEQMCFDMLKSASGMGGRRKELDLSDLITKVISDGPKEFESRGLDDIRSLQMGNSPVLLIDEVDVLFSSFYGDAFNPVALVPDKRYARLQEEIYGAKDVLHSDVKERVISKDDDPEFHETELFQQHVAKMVAAAQTVLSGADSNDRFQLSTDKPYVVKYKLTQHGKEEWRSDVYLGYQNAFQYLHRMDEQGETLGPPAPGRYGYLNIPIGKVSYAEIPGNFDSIFGVTGSLGVLPPKQMEILSDKYKISKCAPQI